MAFFLTGALYKKISSISPVYNVFSAAWFSSNLSFADLESANINFGHFQP